MYIIGKSFKFDAAHQLAHLPGGHKCARLHGHTYTVEVQIASKTLTPEGWVMDFGDLKPIKDWLDTNFDHRNLNDRVDFPTTSENLARYLFEVFERMIKYPNGTGLFSVRVSETGATWAEYGK